MALDEAGKQKLLRLVGFPDVHILRTVYLNQELDNQLKQESRDTGLTKNAIIRIAVACHFDPTFQPSLEDLREASANEKT